MSAVHQLEEAVRRLSDEERVAFRTWFTEFDAEEWDRQFEADVRAGRLDWLIDEARQDLRDRSLHRSMNHRATPRFWSCYQPARTLVRSQRR